MFVIFTINVKYI